jgi:hypothetical protein
MRSNGIFERTDEVSKDPSNSCPNWLEKFAQQLAIEEAPVVKTASKTAVQVRERAYQPSIYEMMSSIISSQKPKYSSVEEAVLDYQKRTGLTDYLKLTATSNLKSVAQEILAEASEDEDGEESLEDDGEDDDTAHADDKKKDPIVGEGSIIEFEVTLDDDDDVNEVKWDPSRKSLIAESIKPKVAIEVELDNESAVEDKPEILNRNPAIESFINNVLDTNYGIQVPALLHSIVETFGKDGISQQIFSDKELLNYINKLIMSKQHINTETSAHLGRGVGTHVDYSGETDSNKDPFTLLIPSKNG